MTFKEFDVVRLLTKVSECAVDVGAVGTVVCVLVSPSEAYEVEFVDSSGRTVAICTLGPDQIESYCP